MTNSHGVPREGGGRLGDWLSVGLACSSVRLLGQQGSYIRSECCVFRAVDEGLQEIWHGILAGPDHSLLLFVVLTTSSTFQRHSLLQSNPTPLPAAWVTLSSQSDGGPLTSDLSVCERRGLWGKAKLAFRGALGDGRVAEVTANFHHGCPSAALL